MADVRGMATALRPGRKADVRALALDEVRENPGVQAREVAARLHASTGLAESTIIRMLRTLEQDGEVQGGLDGRRKAYWPPATVVDIFDDLGPSPEGNGKATDRTPPWDFPQRASREPEPAKPAATPEPAPAPPEPQAQPEPAPKPAAPQPAPRPSFLPSTGHRAPSTGPQSPIVERKPESPGQQAPIFDREAAATPEPAPSTEHRALSTEEEPSTEQPRADKSLVPGTPFQLLGVASAVLAVAATLMFAFGRSDKDSIYADRALSDAAVPQEPATPPPSEPAPQAAEPKPAEPKPAVKKPEAAKKPAAPAGDALAAAKRLRVAVLSGSPVPGIAKRTGGKLKRGGFKVGTVGNASGPSASSSVLFARGSAKEARALAKRLRIRSVRRVDRATNGLDRSAKLFVIVGGDRR